MFTTRLQRFKRHSTLVTLEQNGKQREKKKKEKYVYIYIHISVDSTRQTRAALCVSPSPLEQAQATTVDEQSDTTRVAGVRHRPPLPFRPSAPPHSNTPLPL